MYLTVLPLSTRSVLAACSQCARSVSPREQAHCESGGGWLAGFGRAPTGAGEGEKDDSGLWTFPFSRISTDFYFSCKIPLSSIRSMIINTVSHIIRRMEARRLRFAFFRPAGRPRPERASVSCEP